jgi:hypothetical protein
LNSAEEWMGDKVTVEARESDLFLCEAVIRCRVANYMKLESRAIDCVAKELQCGHVRSTRKRS